MKAKRMVAILVLMALVAGIMPGTHVRHVQAVNGDTGEDDLIDLDDGEGEDDEEDLDDGDYIDVVVRIISEWDHHYNAEVDVINISDEKIDDWEISFDFADTIENVWNAQMTEHDEEIDFYTIKNAVWNQDILAGEKVTFGMTVCYEDEKDELKDWYLTKECMEVAEDAYDVKYTEYSRFDENRVNGQITITNHCDRTIEDWKLDFTSNLTFDEVWGAEVLDNEYASFDNKDSGKNIEPGQSVSFTFLATCDGEETDIFEHILYEMIEIPEELIGDDDWVEEYEADEWARCAYEKADFETEGEYQEYMVRHEAINQGVYVSLNPNAKRANTLAVKARQGQVASTASPLPRVTTKPRVTATPASSQIPTPSLVPTEVPVATEPPQLTEAPAVTPASTADMPQKINQPIVLTDEKKTYTIINAGENAVQAFYRYGSYLYVAQRINAKVVITKAKLKKLENVEEPFAKEWKVKAGDVIVDLWDTSNKKMTLKGYNHGQSLELFKYGGKIYLLVSAGGSNFGNSVSFIQFKPNKEEYVYGNADAEYKLGAKTLTQAGCANKKRKSIGTPKQVEVALSENKSTLLVWCQIRTEDGTKRKIQLSCYSLKSIMKQFKPVEKKAKKYRKKHPKKRMRIQRQFSQLKKTTCYCSALQTDADHNIVKPYNSLQAIDLADKANGAYKIYICGGNDDKNMQPAVACMSLSTNGTTSYLARTDVEPIFTEDTRIFETGQMEMEGMHYKNKKLDFVFVPTTLSKVSKKRQILFTIDSSSVE